MSKLEVIIASKDKEIGDLHGKVVKKHAKRFDTAITQVKFVHLILTLLLVAISRKSKENS